MSGRASYPLPSGASVVMSLVMAPIGLAVVACVPVSLWTAVWLWPVVSSVLTVAGLALAAWRR
jgi:asparagine N-glycosylation enzyme membrane subunit Stt3